MKKSDSELLFNLSAEAGVLGSAILDKFTLHEVRNLLPDETCFVKPEHRTLYRVLLDLASTNGDKWDMIVIRARLNELGLLKAIGGVDYLVRLADAVPCPSNAGYYAGLVADAHKRRLIAEYAESITRKASEAGSTEDLYTKAAAGLQSILETGQRADDCEYLGDIVSLLTFDNADQYISTGFNSLDDAFYGLGAGHVIIIAGRPSMGKTAMMLNMALPLAKETRPVAFFSLEMTKKDLADRIVSSESKIDLACIMRGWLTDEQKERIQQVKSDLAAIPLIIDTTKPLTPERLRSRIFYLKQTKGIEAVFVDYLQLMHADVKKGQSRYEAITDISTQLKSIALSMEIPIVVGCQLNRLVEGRDDKRPRLSDLRDSGSIEQDADVVCLLHRPSYYPQQKQDKNERYPGTVQDDTAAEIIIAKNRRGITGMVPMDFYGRFCTFTENK